MTFLSKNSCHLICSIFSSPNFLKLSRRFKVVKNLAPGEKNQEFGILEGSFGKNRKILQKISSDKEAIKKKKPYWFAKFQLPEHSIKEISLGEVISFLLGEEHAGKVRLMKEEIIGKTYIISKIFQNFETLSAILKKTKNKEEQYEVYLKATENLEGYEYMLAVRILLGLWDCHPGNWGVVARGNRKLVGTFDMLNFMREYKNLYERLVSEKFLKASQEVIEKFEQNRQKIEIKVEFPQKEGVFLPLDYQASKDIISMCRYPQRKSPQVKQELQDVYDKICPQKN